MILHHPGTVLRVGNRDSAAINLPHNPIRWTGIGPVNEPHKVVATEERHDLRAPKEVVVIGEFDGDVLGEVERRSV